jgi:hypothetical protein
VRPNPIACCAIVATLALPACGGNDGNDPIPPGPLDASALSGTYVVDLTQSNSSELSPNVVCQRFQVTMGPNPSWAVVACGYSIQADSVESRADSVILNQKRGWPPWRFSGFNGTPDRATAYWAGPMCIVVRGEAVCEGGTAVWHR